MSKWPNVKLCEVLTKSEDQVEIYPHRTYKEVTVRLWGKGVSLRREATGSEIAATRRYTVKAGQFILSRIDARNGALGLVPKELDGAVVSGDFPVFDTDHRRLMPQFLNWLSKTSGFVDLCRAASEGTTNRVRLKEERFLQMEIPMPPLLEQKRIVEWIEAIASRVDEAKRLRCECDEKIAFLRSSIHLSLSAGQRRPMGELVRLDEDRIPVTNGTEYPQIGIRGFGGGLFERGVVNAQDTTYKSFNRLYEGAIVLSQVKGWEGAIAVCSDRFAGLFASPEYRTFRARPDTMSPQYLAALIPTPWFWSQLAGLTRGAGARRERIRPEMFLAMEFPMPTLQAQRQALQIFDKIHQATAIETIPAELGAVLPSVMNEVFTG